MNPFENFQFLSDLMQYISVGKVDYTCVKYFNVLSVIKWNIYFSKMNRVEYFQSLFRGQAMYRKLSVDLFFYQHESVNISLRKSYKMILGYVTFYEIV